MHAQQYHQITPDHSVTLPRDLYYKSGYRVQWWYFTGHLFDQEEREFGYELTFFTVHVQDRNYDSRFGINTIYISHFALSDIFEKKFYFADQADRGAFGFAAALREKLDVKVGKNRVHGDEKIFLTAAHDAMSLDLQLQPTKPFVLNGQNGYSRKSEESPLIASLYFSSTNISTKGRIQIGNRTYAVTGISWFDREISTMPLGENKSGWDWFSIQLNDSREIMLYLIRNADGSIDPYSSGTFVYKDGTYRNLTRDDFLVTPMSYYRSEKTGIQYPARWSVAIPSEDIRIIITPLLQDQEILAYRTTYNVYWEGSCKVEGTSHGRAYVELTGYDAN
jgi:predicted secreted hydrolase